MTMEELVARVEALEVRLQEQLDREAIRDVLYQYARAADRCDVELFKACYHPDATDFHWFYNGNAHEFAEWVVDVLSEIPASQHSITNPLVKIDGDRAFVESQWYVVHRIPLDDGRYLDQQVEGRYLDVFEKRDGEWKILRRMVVLEAGREHVAGDIHPMGHDHPSVAKRAPHDLSCKEFGILDEELVPVGGFDLWAMARARFAASAQSET